MSGEAIELFRPAIERTPRLITPRLNLARVYQKAGDEAAARTLYRQVLRLDPGNATARAETARAR